MQLRGKNPEHNFEDSNPRFVQDSSGRPLIKRRYARTVAHNNERRRICSRRAQNEKKRRVQGRPSPQDNSRFRTASGEGSWQVCVSRFTGILCHRVAVHVPICLSSHSFGGRLGPRRYYKAVSDWEHFFLIFIIFFKDSIDQFIKKFVW